MRPTGIVCGRHQRRPQSVAARWEGNVHEDLSISRSDLSSARLGYLSLESEPEPGPAEREQPSVAQLES